MKTKVFGKKIENVYSVNHNMKTIKDELGYYVEVYTGKPELIKTPEISKWVELCNFDGEPRYNKHSNLFGMISVEKINISENEEVDVEEEIFRSDLNEVHLHTDKIVEERDVNKENALSFLEAKIKAFNKMMIESNNRLMAYCDLHKLSYEDTDCIELFKLLYPEDEYIIKNGVMKVKEKPSKLMYISDNDTKYFSQFITK